ncbi:MAG: outer membrane beta-barrel protein [Candidatus Eisenbacteria bacterium]|nr:outer membrane beta-barrel protein [Candidatus Eisenbacteria bacterium]
MNGRPSARIVLLLLFLFATIFPLSSARAAGKAGLYLIRMEPYGADAEEYSRPGWGGGAHVVAPIPDVNQLLAGTAGLEFVNLMTETKKFRDSVTGLRTEQQTSQNYGRLYVGAEIGPHGGGFFRPHVGTNIAWTFYWIDTDVVIPDDSARENEIRQDLESEWENAFGWDVTIGLDLNFSNKVPVEIGVRYMKSFGVPQQLGDKAEKIHPEYFQVYAGVGVSFDAFRKS